MKKVSLWTISNLAFVLVLSHTVVGWGDGDPSRSRKVRSILQSDETITFEESIPVPGNVQSQYCNNPATNQGVEFKTAGSIFEPSVATFSGTHALSDVPGDDDVERFKGPMVFSFTTGQSHVGVRVGLDASHAFPVRAILRAFDDPDLGGGTELTPPLGLSLTLGTGPAAITTPLTFSTPLDESTIRRVEIEFLGPTGQSAQEIIDDLTFSESGPPCLIDTQPPIVDILEPLAGATLSNPQVLLHYTVQDDVSGVARIRVVMLGSGGIELTSFFSCGGEAFPKTCPGFPSSLNVDSQFFTFFPAGTEAVRVEATDFAGNLGQDQVSVNVVLPGPDYNLWALGIELTQGIQNQVPTSITSRSSDAPEASLFAGTPLVARKRTVVRVYPGVEDTSVPVVGARATLRCFTFLGADLASGLPCDGPPNADPVTPEITVDPAHGNDLRTLRLNPSLSWNFILPPEWTEPGGPRTLVARVQAPLNLKECGIFPTGCDDAANLFVLLVPTFSETAPLIIQPRFPCVRRSSGVPKEDCDSADPTPGDPFDVADAWDVALSFLRGKDWDNDGWMDPFFSTTYPVADGNDGIKIRTPIIDKFVDGDFNTGNGVVKLIPYVKRICDAFIFDWYELFTDPGELIATAYPPNLRYLGFVPTPTTPAGYGLYKNPCAAANINLNPAPVLDNDFCPNCLNDPIFTINLNDALVAHELTHTYNVFHAGCDHSEPDCDPAPAVFPCPDGGICLSAAELDEPFGFNTYNIAVLPARSGSSHAHDVMSYGPVPTWISRHTFGRIFKKLRSSLSPSFLSVLTPSVEEGVGLSASFQQPALFISGSIEQPGDIATINTVYQLPIEIVAPEGSGSYSLELQRSDGEVLSRRRFDPSSGGEEETSSPFFQLLAFSPDAARLVLKKEDVVLFERTRTANAPTLKVLEPVGGAVWPIGPQTIRWEAADLDGDPLVYTVQYSNDLGTTWKTFALNATETTLEVEAALLAGSASGQALIRVFASDGFNSVIAESAPFTVTDKPPHVRILAPAEGTVFPARQLISLIGAAIDPDGGTLNDPAYSWNSDRDGPLGQGHELRLTTLSPGQHLIMLTAQDSTGNAAQDSIMIEVVGQPNTQPLADAGPDQTGFVSTSIDLDGRASFDPDGDLLSFSWRFASVPGGLVVLPELDDPTSATPTFLTLVAGTYGLELVVRDGEVNSFPSRVAIEVQEQAFQYSAKIICGKQKDARDMRLARGLYATTVNIHNLHDFTITFLKKLALTYPPGGQRMGRILPIATDTLAAGGALQTDCVDLQQRLFPNGFPTSYIEGFVVIESPVRLDVTAVYTSARPGGWFSKPKVTSIDIEKVEGREIEKQKGRNR